MWNSGGGAAAGPRLLPEARLPRAASAALGGLAAEDHAGAVELGDEAAGVVGDVALEEAEGAGALDEVGGGGEVSGPDRLEELAGESEGGEGLVVLEGGGEGGAHRGVGEVAEDAAVEGAHGVGVALGGVELDDGAAEIDVLDDEADEPGDGGLRGVAGGDAAEVVEVLGGA